MRPILRFVLLTALRDRLFGALAALLAVVMGGAVVFGGAALVEQGETTVVLAAGAARLVLAVGLVTFVATQVQRLYDSREIEVLLARPISRPKLVAALAAGVAVVAVLPAVAVAAVLAPFVPDLAGWAVWAATLAAEVVVLALFTLAAALVLERAVTATLAGLAFYTAARLMTFVMGVVEAHERMGGGGPLADVLGWIATAIAAVVPRLDLFAHTGWLVHGIDDPAPVLVAVAQLAVAGPLLIAVAALDLSRKRF